MMIFIMFVGWSLKIKKKIFKIMKVQWGNNVTLTYQVLLAFYNLRKQN